MDSDSELKPSGQTSTRRKDRQIKCDVCHDLCPGLLNAKEGFYFPPWRTRAASLFLNHEDVSLSELSGCKICRIIVHAVGRYSPEREPAWMMLEIQAMDDAFQNLFPLTLEVQVPMTASEIETDSDSDQESGFDVQLKESMPDDSEGGDKPMKHFSGDSGDELPVDDLKGKGKRTFDHGREDKVEDDYDEVNEEEGNATGQFRSIKLQLYEEQGQITHSGLWGRSLTLFKVIHPV